MIIIINASKYFYFKMSTKLYFLILTEILFSFVHLRQSARAVEIEKSIDITLESDELYVYSQGSKDGVLIHLMTLNHALEDFKNKIFYAVVDDAKVIDQTNNFNISENVANKEDKGKYQYTNNIVVKKDQYGITKVIGLTKGETVNVYAYYVSKTMVYVLIVVGIIILLLVCCLIICCIKKICC